jgi:hypothetical protein
MFCTCNETLDVFLKQIKGEKIKIPTLIYHYPRDKFMCFRLKKKSTHWFVWSSLVKIGKGKG